MGLSQKIFMSLFLNCEPAVINSKSSFPILSGLWDHGSQICTWFLEIAQTTDFYEHQHRPPLQQDHTHTHGPQRQHGLGQYHGLRWQQRPLRSVCPLWQYDPCTSTWLQVAAQTIDICLDFGGNTDHRHRPQLQQDPRPGYGPQWQNGLGSLWPQVVDQTKDIIMAFSGNLVQGHKHGFQLLQDHEHGTVDHRYYPKWFTWAAWTIEVFQGSLIAKMNRSSSWTSCRCSEPVWHVPVPPIWGLSPSVSPRLLHTTHPVIPPQQCMFP